MAWTTTLVLILGIALYGVAAESYLTNLAKYVKRKSDPDVAPQSEHGVPVEVTFGYALMNIADVDREHNTITTETFVNAQWNTGITWKPAKFSDIEKITLPANYFWIPSMQPLHNAVEVKGLGPKIVVLMNNGTAFYQQVYKTSSLCDVSHVETGATCNSKNSLWGYSKDQVTIKAITGDTSGTIPYFAGSGYKITNFNMNFIDFPFDGKVYQIVDSTVTIQAKPTNRRGPFKLSFHWD